MTFSVKFQDAPSDDSDTNDEALNDLENIIEDLPADFDFLGTFNNAFCFFDCPAATGDLENLGDLADSLGNDLTDIIDIDLIEDEYVDELDDDSAALLDDEFDDSYSDTLDIELLDFDEDAIKEAETVAEVSDDTDFEAAAVFDLSAFFESSEFADLLGL